MQRFKETIIRWLRYVGIGVAAALPFLACLVLIIACFPIGLIALICLIVWSKGEKNPPNPADPDQPLKSPPYWSFRDPSDPPWPPHERQ